MKRNETIDIAKGISILLMTLSHFTLGNTYPTINTFNTYLIIFKVPLFIFLSGYLFSFHDSFKHFAKNKTKGLLIPSLVLIIGLHLLYALIKPDFRKEAIDNLMQLSFQDFLLPMWFPIGLYFSLIIFYYLLSTWKSANPKAVIFATITLLILLFFQSFQLPYLYAYTFIYLVFFLTLGYAIKQAKLNLQQQLLHNTSIFITALFSYSLLMYFKSPLDIRLNVVGNIFGSVFSTLLAAIIGIYLVVFIAKNYVRKIPVLSGIFITCGKASLFILCFHNIIEPNLYKISRKLIPATQKGILVLADISNFILTIALCLFIYYLAKRTPIINKVLFIQRKQKQ